MRGPDLGGHEHIIAFDAGRAQAFTDLAFVVIDLGSVDVAIAELYRLLDQTRASSSAQFPGAQPDGGNVGAVGLDELHRGYSVKPDAIMSRRDRAANIASSDELKPARRREKGLQTPSLAHGR